MDIRLMKPADYSACYDLWLRTPGMGLNSIDDSEEGIARYLKRNPSTCFVAEEEGHIVGVILAGHDGRRGHISHTAVDGAFQRRGIGRQLVEHVMAAMEQEGIIKVNLVVFSHNEKGSAFWESMGFTLRTDLHYRNRSIRTAARLDT